MARGRLHKNDIVGKAAKKRRLTPRSERLPGEVVQVNLRMPEALRQALTNEAMAAKRSLNAEMLLRLERSFQRENADEKLERAEVLLAKTRELYDEMVDEAGERWIQQQIDLKRGK